MSKELEEIVKEFDELMAGNSYEIKTYEFYGGVDNLSGHVNVINVDTVMPTIDKLRTLAEPVQYVVRIEKLMSEPGQVFAYKAIHNNELLELHNNLERLKEEVFAQLEQAHKLTCLPPITIEQITFVEV